MKLLLLTAAIACWGAALPARAQGPAAPNLANATLEFVENQGQWHERARYAAALPSGQLFAEADGLTLALLADGGPGQHGHREAAGKPAAPAGPVRGHTLRLRFAGAGAAVLSAETPTNERRSYFRGADQRHWAAGVRGYRALRYDGLWPGIGARVYESADQRLEYDFTLAPGARPEAIALRHEGADGLTLDPEGNLLVRTSVGTVRESAPRAWQLDAAGQRQPVPCRYELTGQTVRFVPGKYDHARALTIDPTVVFASYSGSAANNWGFTATYDNAGNLYSGGIAFEVGYPTTAGAFQTSFAAIVDIAIIKFDTHVSGPAARVWATYLGGRGADFPASLVVNSRNELLVLGTSGSADYPTTAGAVQPGFAGGTPAEPLGYGAPYDAPVGTDLVISCLNATGTGLVGSTFLGGSGNDGLLPLAPGVSALGGNPQLAHNYGDPFRGDIFVDAADNVYVASHTTSTDFPVARGLGRAYGGGTSDGVVCKFTPNLGALSWASYLGGSGADAIYSLQVEPGSGDVYVAGGTLSPNFPTSAGAYQTSRPGNVDGFVARIAAGGTSLARASYVGTAAYDQAYFLQLGTDGGVYLLGQTLGSFPVTPGLYTTPGGTQFIQKLDASLSQRQLSTVFGSTAPTEAGLLNLDPTAFLVDRCDRVFVCGWGGEVNGRAAPTMPASFGYLDANGTTTGLPTTSNAQQRTTDGSNFYLAQFAAGLTDLAYATFYGDTAPGTEGEHVDGGTSRFDPRGVVYQAVCSCFTNAGFPIPPGANTYATANGTGIPGYGVGCNNAAFVLDFRPSVANAGPNQTVCATAGPQPLLGTPGGGSWAGPGVTGSVATGYVFTPSLALVGASTLTYTLPGTGLCTTTGTRLVTVLPLTSAGPDTLLCGNNLQPFRLRGTPAGGTFSGPGVSGSVAGGFVFTPPANFSGSATLTYTVGSAACSATATRVVSVAPAPAIQPFWEPLGCPETRLAPLTLQFSFASTINYPLPVVEWDFGDGTTSAEVRPVHTYATPGTYQPRLKLLFGAGRCSVLAAAPVVQVAERKLANIITPNGDPLNQTFKIGADCPPRFQVFSRWGKVVFDSPTYHDEWSAEGLPAGNYYYLLTYPNGQRVKGWIDVVR